jgi:hypothetical protein
VYTQVWIEAKTLEIPLSCRFFIRGEPPNKNAAKSPLRRGTKSSSYASCEESRLFLSKLFKGVGGFRSTHQLQRTCVSVAFIRGVWGGNTIPAAVKTIESNHYQNLAASPVLNSYNRICQLCLQRFRSENVHLR